MKLPVLYAIIDRETLDRKGLAVERFAQELRNGGVRLLQYRDKRSGPQEILRAAESIAEVFAGTDSTLILNDRADLAALLGWGVHVGQGDLPMDAAKRIIGSKIAGLSTHNEAQWKAASQLSADYVAVGPVFSTNTKADAEPVVRLEGVRSARAVTTCPLVAIGGIDATNARSVIGAGADSVAVISALLPSAGRSARQKCEDLLSLLTE